MPTGPVERCFYPRSGLGLHLLLVLPLEVRPPFREHAVSHLGRHCVGVRSVELLRELEQEQQVGRLP